MLGMLKSSPVSGKERHDASSLKGDAQTKAHSEMVDSGAIARAAAANAAAMRHNSDNYQASLSQDSPLQSPTSVMKTQYGSTEKGGSLRVRKGVSSFHNHHLNGRRVGSYRGSSTSYSDSADVVEEQYLHVRHRCQRELGVGMGLHVLDTSYPDLMEWIRDERLTRLPHKGGCWDRVLISAQHFADHVSGLGHAIEFFSPSSEAASNLVFGQCLLLLQRLGHENAPALDTAFTLFYQIGLEIAPLLGRDEVLRASPQIMDNVSRAFSDLLTIVSDVAVAYYGAVHRLDGDQSSTKLDVYSRFGHHMDSFRARVRLCSNEIWRYVLERSMEDPEQIQVLQGWLTPQDSVLATLASDHVNLVSRAEEYTCMWMQPHLNGFFKGDDKCLFVQGRSGSGKTTLANWVVERLQRPISRKSVSTLNFFFNSTVMGLETPLAMLKTFMSQLLSQRIGEVEIYRVIMDAYLQSRTLHSAKKQEEIMWTALEAALNIPFDDEGEMALIVDLDDMEAKKTRGAEVAVRLQKLVEKNSGVRLIIFSSSGDLKHATTTTSVDMVAENFDDIQTIIRHGLARVQAFAHKDEVGQESIVDNLTACCDGSAVYAFLAVRYLKLQKSDAALSQAIGALAKSPHTVADAVQKLLAVLHLENESRTLLSILAAAERPLARREVELLLQAQPQQGHMSDNSVQVDSIIKSIAPFAMTGEGLITLRHRSIKDALMASPALPKDVHKPMLMRLFICANKHLLPSDNCEPMMSFLDQERVETRLASDRILEYTLRYWVVHFKKASSLHKPDGQLDLHQDFSSIFPSSVGFVLLESGAWRCQSFPEEAMEMFQDAYRVRNTVFGQNHPTVLQSTLICANFYENILSKPGSAIEWYFKASNIGRSVFGQHAELVLTCCTTILRLSETFVSTTRTEIVTYREQTLLTLITIYKHRYGERSDEVIELYKTLVELYTSISEVQKATEISTKVKELTIVTRDGHQHDRPTNGHRHLSINIKKKDHRHVESYDDFLFNYKEEEKEESLTIIRVEEKISIVVRLISEKKFSQSEEILLELWLKLDEHCRGSQACEWHEKKIQVILKYAEVLHALGRKSEASALLLSCWTEYSSHSVSSFESVVVQLHQLGIWMKRLHMSSVALTVFQKCWSWFKSSHKEQTSTFHQLEEHIAETSKELVKTSSSTTTTSVHESSEIMREVFESSFSSSTFTETETETKEVTSTTIELCESLATVYMKEERWSQAATVTKQTLMRSSFSSFFSESYESIDLKSSLVSKHIDLVMKLAECYIHQKRYEKAEFLYLRLYRLHRKHTSRLDDAVVVKYIDLYVNFLKKQNLTNQLISFYQELLIEYRSFYGHSHTKTIDMLYALGDLCRTHSVTHGYFVEYYAEIVTNLNQGALVCHENAFRALLVVADHYHQSQRFSESLVYYRSIMTTFCKFGTKYKYFEDITVLQQIMDKYYKALEETKVEITEQLTILKEIRHACIQYFGEESSITVNVTLSLAEVCQRSEKHQFEAVSYYEHVLTHSKTVSKRTIERSQSTLRSLYVKQVTSSSSSKTVTKETMEKATEMSYQRYVEIRKSHSVTSQTTLTQLKELVTLYHKQSKTEAATSEMRSLAIECLTKVTSSQELMETAKTLASMYISCGYTSHAQALVRELKLQLVYKIASKDCGFNLTGVDAHKCFAFLAAFEWSVRSDMSLTIASFMAELLAEHMFYERFSTSVKAKSEMHIVLMHAARLRGMLLHLNRKKDPETVESITVDYFMSAEPSVAKSCSKASVRAFLSVILSHFSARPEKLTQDSMTKRAGRAAVIELRSLMQRHEYKRAVDLARCTYLFLMAHEGLDDPTEISLGFQLCLLMAGRDISRDEQTSPSNGNGTSHAKKHTRNLPEDKALRAEMMELSKKILGEVLEICKVHDISLVRCQWAEINDLISLLGEVQDLERLQWLLTSLWESRDGQASWGHDVMLSLGMRLVQVSFMSAKTDSERKIAIRMADDLAYNVRRVHGARHQRTLDIMSLLASLYTSTALHVQSTATDQKRGADMARLYYKKAASVHEDVLKLLLDADADEGSDDESVTSSNYSTVRSMSSPTFRRKMSSSSLLNQHLQHHHNHNHNHNQQQQQQQQQHHHHNGLHKGSITHEQQVEAIRTHLRLLKITLQRLGEWARSRHEYENLTAKVWREHCGPLRAAGVKEDEVMAGKWKLEGYGNGKAECAGKDGCFHEPASWGVTYQVAGVQ